ncbi:MAG: hypothetical protein ABII00_14800 [Elusimicrobiota bacterium]
MEQRHEAAIAAPLKMHSLILLAGGALTLVPFMELSMGWLLVQVFGVKLGWGITLAYYTFVTGQLLIFLPLLTIPLCSLWVYYRGGDIRAGRRFLGRGFLRYFPALFGLGLQMYIVGIHGIYVAPAIFGSLLVGYAIWLLRRDRAAIDAVIGEEKPHEA